MPKIGMRIIKSAVAVFLCFIIDMLRGEGIPFYSAIAAVLCMQREFEDSKAKGKSRMIATLIGGICGMGMLYLLKFTAIEVNSFYHYAFVSVALIPLIYLTVLMKQPDCTYLSCVVFLCICISHGNDENPFSFACNRIMDTWIGIFVALGINALYMPHRIHKNACIEIPLSYLSDHDKLSNYMQHHLNRFSKQGLQLLITSSKTPAQLNQCVPASLLTNCFLLLDGAMLYDRKNDTCKAQYEMSYPLWKELYEALSASGFQAFLYEITDDRLYIHHHKKMNEQEKLFYFKCLKDHQNHIVLHEQNINESFTSSCLLLELRMQKELIHEAYQLLKSFIQDITWIVYEESSDTINLRIYPIQLTEQKQSIQGFENDQIKRIRYKHYPMEKQVIQDIKKLFYYQ